MFRNLLSSLAAMALTWAAPAYSAEPVQQHNSNAVWFENWIGLSNTTMTISAPNGKVTSVFAESGTPVFRLSGNEVTDGIYRYELKAATDETVEIVNQVDNGRGENGKGTMQKPFSMNGYFTVSRGVIITAEDVKEEEG